MILMTDGVPNANPGGACPSGGSTPWTGDIPVETNSLQDHNCPMYFAEQARLNNIRLYVIGLGYGVNQDYLRQVAQTGGGQAYFSASGGDLDLIFAEILNNIYVRLVE
jgi:hypothetical protein